MARRDASAVHGEEHTRAYRETDGEYGHDWRHWPAYDSYQERTSREIPVVVLERA